MSDFIEDATGEARGIGHNYSNDQYNKMNSGVTAIPVDEVTEIKVDFRNPQGYDLDLWLEGTINSAVVDRDNPPDPSEVKISPPDPNMQYAIVTITNPARFNAPRFSQGGALLPAIHPSMPLFADSFYNTHFCERV